MPSGQNQDDSSRDYGLVTEVSSTSETSLLGQHTTPLSGNVYSVKVTHRKETQNSRYTNLKDIAKKLVSTHDGELHNREETAQDTRHEDIDE